MTKKTRDNRTVQPRTVRGKKEFLEQLKKTPIVQLACEKIFVARSTIYRWRDEDKEFGKALDVALREGRLLVNDVAESQLLAAIRERNMTAILFWLKHHHPSYTTKVEVTARIQEQYELSPEQKAVVDEALQRVALPKLHKVGNPNQYESTDGKTE